jgi:radical SAM protein with 4Fe4S-binding SPASM domain
MYNELKIVADYIIDNDLYNKIYISLFEENQFMPMNENDNNNYCGGTTQGGHIAVNHTGKLFPCIRYMDSSLNGRQEPIWIGEVGKGILITEKDKSNYAKLSSVTRRSQSTDECFYCPVAQGCSWCSAYNYEETGSVNKRLTYICIMHKATALANVYYWNKLYKKLNLPNIKINYLSNKDSINIIGEKELNDLINITKR